VLGEGNEQVEQAIAVETKDAPAQLMVAAERRDALLGHGDERLDHRRRDVVAVKRGVQGGLVAAGPRMKPVALQHPVVESCIGVQLVGVRLVERVIGGATILLIAARLQDRAILTVGQRHLVAGRHLDGGRLHVGGREGRIAVVRHAPEPACEREQTLALFVEHMLLLVKQALDRKPVDRQVRLAIHPSANRVERNGQQLGVEPGARLLLLGEENLHLLAAGVVLVVALILVVPERRVVPDAVAEGSHFVHGTKCVEEGIGSRRQRPAPLCKGSDGVVEPAVAAQPFVGSGADRRQVPSISGGDRLPLGRSAAPGLIRLGHDRRNASRAV
jgi:hypothetical protein